MTWEDTYTSNQWLTSGLVVCHCIDMYVPTSQVKCLINFYSVPKVINVG